MDTIETFDFNELKICSDELREIEREKPCETFEANTIEKYREFKLEYKGGRPAFRVDGNLSFLIYHILTIVMIVMRFHYSRIN